MHERQRLQSEQQEAYERAVALDLQRVSCTLCFSSANGYRTPTCGLVQRHAEEQTAREARQRAEREAREAREAAERQEATRRAKEQAKQQRIADRARRAALIPAEPPAGQPAAVVRVRLLDGSRLERRFAPDNSVQSLYDYVEVNAKYDEDFEIVTPPPNPKV